MRRYARSEGNRRIHRRFREEPEADEEGARAEIGSRVFPFRTPTPASPASPASMPTGGARRSTRVFVKTGDAELGRVLRSGGQVSAPKPKSDWMKVFDSINGDGSWWKSGWTEPETKKDDEEKKRFGVVYRRKRKRSASTMESSCKDRRFGIVFSRKHLKTGQKPLLLAVEPKIEKKIPVELAVLVESSSGRGSVCFARILLAILSCMRRERVRVYDLAVFLSLGAIVSIFAANGVHFVTVEDGKNDILVGNSVTGFGFCRIHGTSKFTPLISLNFSAIPVLFNNFHLDKVLASFCFSGTLFRKKLVSMQEKAFAFVPYKEGDFSVPFGTGVTGTEFTVSATQAVVNSGLSVVIAMPAFPQSSVTPNGYGFKFRKHQKKRTSLRTSTNRKSSRLNSRLGSLGSYLNSARASSVTKLDLCVDPMHVKLHDTCLPEESDVAVAPRFNSKQRSLVGKKSPIEKIKELRSALAEVRQNIDSACCKANILVTDTDRCWREDGAEVMLELSNSQQWLLAVKRLGLTKYLLNPQDLKPCVVNRFTHAYMWSGDDRWKLEFCDKWDWYVFKELHMECRERNIEDVPVKVIPVPVVREVPGYEGDAAPSFLRPDTYIHSVNDEVGRALASKVAQYDMDLADEEWLRQLTSSTSSTEEGAEVGSSYISEEDFETIMFTLERDAYSCANDPFNKERALGLCQGLGRREIISVVYEYWLKKRKQKCAALVRVFQGPPLRRARRRRSFKRQRSQDEHSQAGRGKPVFFWQADQEVQKVKEAETAANRAAEVAIQLRSRAQMLVANADLAVYKSTMALRIAETIRASSSEEPPRIESSILFD